WSPADVDEADTAAGTRDLADGAIHPRHLAAVRPVRRRRVAADRRERLALRRPAVEQLDVVGDAVLLPVEQDDVAALDVGGLDDREAAVAGDSDREHVGAVGPVDMVAERLRAS